MSQSQTRTVFLTAASSAAIAAVLTLVGRELFVADVLAAEPAAPGAASAAQVSEILQSLNDAKAARVRLEDTLLGLSRRLKSVEEASSRQPVPSAPRLSKTAAAAAADEVPGGETGAASKMTRARFRGLLTKMMRSALDGTATLDEQAAFWKAARTGTVLGDLIGSLEDQIEQTPRDTDLRMELADSYVAKLLTVASGPERGVWGAKAETQWRANLEIDPNHWDSQYSLAFNHSMYPEFLNKTDESVRGFENALAIQRREPTVEPRHAKTYLGLARMYKRQGKIDKALDLMREASAMFPTDKAVGASLQSLQANKKNNK